MSQPIGGEGPQDDGATWQGRARASGAILTFILLAFAWSSSVGLAATQVRDQSTMAGNALLMLSGFGPSLAGLAVVAGIGGRVGLTELAAAEKVDRSFLGKLLSLTLLAPDLVEAILEGRCDAGLPTLLRPFPASWHEQASTLAAGSSPA